MNLTLYQLSHEFRDTADKLADMELDQETISDTLESISLPLEKKAERVAMVVRNLDSLADQIKQAEKEMADRRKKIEKRADDVRQYLMENMHHAGMTSIDCPYFKLSIKNNPESVDVYDDKLIPSEYMREIPARQEPDKVALKSAMKEGKEVEGARLTRTTRLEIK